MQNDGDRQRLATQFARDIPTLEEPPSVQLKLTRNSAGIYQSIGVHPTDDAVGSSRPSISRLVLSTDVGNGHANTAPDSLVDMGRRTAFAAGERIAARNGGIIPKTIAPERVFIKNQDGAYDSLSNIVAEYKLASLSPEVRRLVSDIVEAPPTRSIDGTDHHELPPKSRSPYLHPVKASAFAREPEKLLNEVARRTPFTRQDVEDAAKHHFSGVALNEAVEAILRSPRVTRIAESEGASSFYTTTTMLKTERAMLSSVDAMKRNRDHGVSSELVDVAVGHGPLPTSQQLDPGRFSLSEEQARAVRHATGPEQITVIVGYAGAGKSTMLASARQAWEAAGYTVNGAALSGKAAQGLVASSQIPSRTLAAWDYGWQKGELGIGNRDIMVIDEAGMIGSKQMARFVKMAHEKNAKLVLVGDAEQLQPIDTGAPFKAIGKQAGYAALTGVRRQNAVWQQRASEKFGQRLTTEAISEYVDHGVVRLTDNRNAAISSAVQDYVADVAESRKALAAGSPEPTVIALAYTHEDVTALNQGIRAALRSAGDRITGPVGADHVWQVEVPQGDAASRKETRNFASGDKLVFLKNNGRLGVLNGMSGTIETVTQNSMRVKLAAENGQSAKVIAIPASYRHFDHGYAITIHKSQGGTWDRSYVVASGKMDSHLSYVAMSRHRHSVQIYGSREEFKDTDALARGLSRPNNTGLPRSSFDVHEERMLKLTAAMKRGRLSGSVISDTSAIANTSDTSAVLSPSRTHQQQEHSGKRDSNEVVQKWRDEVERQRSFGTEKSSEAYEASRRRNEMVQERGALSRNGLGR